MFQVIKATGEKEPFDEEKVQNSILRAGIPKELENQTLEYVKTSLYEGIPTNKIYELVTNFLAKSALPYGSSRYSLKQAIMTLGPTGYPFEDFVSRILEIKGYTTETRKILQGKCITHEIDVIAQKITNIESKKIMVEVKYHNLPGTKTDVHVALYTKARFDDVKDKNDLNEVYLVTNTKVSQDAIAYAACVGMKIISWSYPIGESLRDLVERNNLTPITTLTSLSQGQKKQLLENHIVLCKDIYSNPNCLKVLNLPSDKNVLSEAQFITSN